MPKDSEYFVDFIKERLDLFNGLIEQIDTLFSRYTDIHNTNKFKITTIDEVIIDKQEITLTGLLDIVVSKKYSSNDDLKAESIVYESIEHSIKIPSFIIEDDWNEELFYKVKNYLEKFTLDSELYC